MSDDDGRVCIRISKETEKRLKGRADKEDKLMSEVARDAIRAYLEGTPDTKEVPPKEEHGKKPSSTEKIPTKKEEDSIELD